MLFVVLATPQIASAEDPCQSSNDEVMKFASGMPRLSSSDLSVGRFDVKKVDDGLVISYLINGKVSFQSKRLYSSSVQKGKYPNEFYFIERNQSCSKSKSDELCEDTTPEIIPIMISDGYSGLFFNIPGGGVGGRGPGCSYVVFSSLPDNNFISKELHVPYSYPIGTSPPLYIAKSAKEEDMDSDGETEIVALEYPQWSLDWDCPFSFGGDTPYWHSIYHLSPQRGELVEVNDRFPKYYASLAEKYRNIEKEVSSRTKIPPRCENELQQLIKKAENLANTQVADRNNTDIAKKPLILNIERPPLKERQDFISLGRFYGPIENEFLEVAKSEKYKLDASASYEDECYYGVVDTLARLQANRIVDIGLKKLAVDVFAAALGTFNTGSVIGDYLLKLGVEMMNSAVLDVPLDETALVFVVDNTVGYVAGQATKSYLVGAAVPELTDKMIERLLYQDDPISWELSGNNFAAAKRNIGAPPTSIKAEVFYNPYTHYTTAVVGATCQLSSGSRKNLYILRYEVTKTAFGGAAKSIEGSYRYVVRQLQ